MSDSVEVLEVPFHRPSIGREEIEEVVRTLESGWLTTGRRTAEFEKRFSEYVQAPYCQAVSSCTAGLHLALTALQIGPGAEVITTPLTFCATVNTILHVGATPVLADIREDGNIDPASIEARITHKTRAIVPVHLSGLPCDMEAIWKIARQHGLFVIEDSAHAAGSFYRGLPIGAGHPELGCSDAAVFSFYATKNLTTGEGGMVTTHNPELAEAVRILCLHGISKSAWNRYADRGQWYYEVLRPGFKYNLTDLQSAIGLHQLAKLNSFVLQRARYAAIYNQRFADSRFFELPPDRSDSIHSWHLYILRLNLSELEINRNQFIQSLQERGIGVSVHFIPIPLHPFFQPFASLPQNQCSKCLELYPRLISLPLYPAMTEAQVEYVAACVKETARAFRRKKLVMFAARQTN